MLDDVADSLEKKGLIKEAYEIDKIADAVEAGKGVVPGIPPGATPADIFQRRLQNGFDSMSQQEKDEFREIHVLNTKSYAEKMQALKDHNNKHDKFIKDLALKYPEMDQPLNIYQKSPNRGIIDKLCKDNGEAHAKGLIDICDTFDKKYNDALKAIKLKYVGDTGRHTPKPLERELTKERSLKWWK